MPADFDFIRAVGEAFLNVYPSIVARRKDTPYDEAARDRLLIKRGRYVEFNLVYDRGTKFGFSTDADPGGLLDEFAAVGEVVVVGEAVGVSQPVGCGGPERTLPVGCLGLIPVLGHDRGNGL
jgi:hypothetical protein